MKVWKVEVELNMNASNTIKLEIVASTENKARINAERAVRKKHKAFFTKIVYVKL
jgi:hypothetical protein|nr:MAG TPA: hypothetical protein [Crassvirales sp.]